MKFYFINLLLLLTLLNECSAQPDIYLNRVDPIYPSIARQKNQYGLVGVGLLVDWDGFLQSAWIQASSGHLPLDQSALAAARKSKYKGPPQDGGRKSGYFMVAKYMFVLPDKDAQSEVQREITPVDYEHFMFSVVPTMKCRDVVSDARRFSKERPSQPFSMMLHYRVINEFLMNKKSFRLLSVDAYNQALIKCASSLDASLFEMVWLVIQDEISKPMPRERELRKMVVGAWSPLSTNAKGPSHKTVYGDDGTFELVAYKADGCEVLFKATGTWNLEGDALKAVVKTSERNDVFPVPHLMEARVLSISDSTKVMRSKSDSTIQYRIKDNICAEEN